MFAFWRLEGVIIAPPPAGRERKGILVVDMSGKVCVVTGANAGIGLATALGLAEMNASVVMACRDAERGQSALERVVSRCGNRKVSLIPLDLASQRSIRDFAEAFAEKHASLDVLVNNAATVPAERELTDEGLEVQFGVNHLGPFLLTNLLLDRLRAGAPSRVVNVSSMVHRNVSLDFDDLQAKRKYDFFRVYGQSKLANVLFTYELARRLDGSGVVANCLHPGMVRTKILRDVRGLVGLVIKYGTYLLSSPRSGARTSVFLASSPEVEGVSGKYFVKCREAASSVESHDVEDARRLWEVSAKLAGLDG